MSLLIKTWIIFQLFLIVILLFISITVSKETCQGCEYIRDKCNQLTGEKGIYEEKVAIYCESLFKCQRNPNTGRLEWSKENPCPIITTTTSTTTTSTTTSTTTTPTPTEPITSINNQQYFENKQVSTENVRKTNLALDLLEHPSILTILVFVVIIILITTVITILCCVFRRKVRYKPNHPEYGSSTPYSFRNQIDLKSQYITPVMSPIVNGATLTRSQSSNPRLIKRRSKDQKNEDPSRLTRPNSNHDLSQRNFMNLNPFDTVGTCAYTTFSDGTVTLPRLGDRHRLSTDYQTCLMDDDLPFLEMQVPHVNYYPARQNAPYVYLEQAPLSPEIGLFYQQQDNSTLAELLAEPQGNHNSQRPRI